MHLLPEREGRHAARLFKDHLANHRWNPTQHLAELVRGVFAPSAILPRLRNLYLEGRAIEIVAETIGAMMRSDRKTADDGILTRRDRLRLQRAMDLIAADAAEPLSVDAIAREAGVSSSGLQRLFQLSEGLSVFEYVRQVRLERAFSALRSGEVNVQEASSIAGYSTPALWPMMAAALIAGLTSGISLPALAAAQPMLVGRDELPAVAGLNAIASRRAGSWGRSPPGARSNGWGCWAPMGWSPPGPR